MKIFPKSPCSLQTELLLAVKRDTEMLIRLLCNTASARRPREKTLLQKIRFIDVLKRNGFFIDRRCQRLHADRSAGLKLNNAAQHAPVQRIETEMIDLQPVKRFVCNVPGYPAVGGYLCEIAYTA